MCRGVFVARSWGVLWLSELFASCWEQGCVKTLLLYIASGEKGLWCLCCISHASGVSVAPCTSREVFAHVSTDCGCEPGSLGHFSSCLYAECGRAVLGHCRKGVLQLSYCSQSVNWLPLAFSFLFQLLVAMGTSPRTFLILGCFLTGNVPQPSKPF